MENSPEQSTIVQLITREIDFLGREMNRRLSAQDELLKSISTKLDYTNGKTRKHEWYFKVLWWGAGVVGTGLVAFIPYAYTTWRENMKLDKEQQQALIKSVQESDSQLIVDTFNKYGIKVDNNQ